MKRVYILIATLAFFGCSREIKKEIPVAEVKTGTFYIEIYEEGEISATQSVSISSPNISYRYGSLKIAQMVDDGREVSEGDTVVVFDPSEVSKAIVDAESRLEMHKADLEKMMAQHQSDLEEMKADLEITRLSQEISKIRFESANYEADIRRKEIQLNLQKANIALERAKEQMENRLKIQSEEVKQKRLAIRQSENELAEANQTLRDLNLITPAPGIAIINKNWNSGNKFQVGDQVWSGFPLIELPDLTELKAKVQINEVDISKVTKGLKVQIRPDAFSDSIYYGEVVNVANLAIGKNNNQKIKVFPVEILISGTGTKLLPGLTVSCKLIVDEIKDVHFIPLDALYTENGEEFVFVKKGTGFEKRLVETGETNTDFVVIRSGLEGKEEVALTDPRENNEKKNGNDKQ